MFKTTIDECESVVYILKEGNNSTFVAMIVDCDNSVRFTIGQVYIDDGYYQMMFLKEDWVYDVLSGTVDWETDEVWTDGLYGEMVSGHFVK